MAEFGIANQCLTNYGNAPQSKPWATAGVCRPRFLNQQSPVSPRTLPPAPVARALQWGLASYPAQPPRLCAVALRFAARACRPPPSAVNLICLGALSLTGNGHSDGPSPAGRMWTFLVTHVPRSLRCITMLSLSKVGAPARCKGSFQVGVRLAEQGANPV